MLKTKNLSLISFCLLKKEMKMLHCIADGADLIERQVNNYDVNCYLEFKFQRMFIPCQVG